MTDSTDRNDGPNDGRWSDASGDGDDGGSALSWIAAAGIAATIIVSALAYPHLPPAMAVHWNYRGQPNGWAPRAVGGWLLPALAGVVWLTARWLPRSDPRLGRSPKTLAAYWTIVAATIGLLLAVHLMLLAVATGWHVPVMMLAQMLLGALCVVVGAAMPSIGRNRYVGVRTRSTMASDRVWDRAQRTAGLALVVAGLIIVVTSVIPPPAGVLIGLAALVVASILPLALSRPPRGDGEDEGPG